MQIIELVQITITFLFYNANWIVLVKITSASVFTTYLNWIEFGHCSLSFLSSECIFNKYIYPVPVVLIKTGLSIPLLGQPNLMRLSL